MTGSPACVFTAVFGGYESLNPQPRAEGSEDRWLCFTDDPELVSDHWEVVLVEPVLPLDPHRSSRHIKMLGHPLVREYERTLWIDNSVVLHQAPGTVTDEWLAAADAALCEHSYRDTVLDEFIAVLDDSLDDPGRILEQLDHYSRSMPEVLDQRPLWGALIARRWTSEVDAAMTTWWTHLLRYSRRDQLSLIAAITTTGLDIERITLDNFASPLHEWPVAPDRDRTMRHVSLVDRPAPPMADLRMSQRRLEASRSRVAELEQANAELDSEVRRLIDERDRIMAERDRAIEARDHLDDRLRQSDEQKQQAAQAHRHDAELLHARVERIDAERSAAVAAVDQLMLEWTDLRAQLDAIESSRSWKAARIASRLLHPTTIARGAS
jgi:hypothetical protein